MARKISTTRSQIAKGGRIYLVIVPADGSAAASKFGTNETDKEKSLRLTIDLPELGRRWRACRTGR
jgi:hypothetical protein